MEVYQMLQKLKGKSKFLKMVAVLSMVAMLLSLSAGLAMADPYTADSLTIKYSIDGGQSYEVYQTYTSTQMSSMVDVNLQFYSHIDRFPAPCLDLATGVSLSNLLDDAGIPALDGSSTLIFKCNDGYGYTFTNEELLETIRYYYPNLREEWDPVTRQVPPGDIAAAMDDAEEVPTILAVEDYWQRNGNPAEMTEEDLTSDSRFRLCFGQTDVINPDAFMSLKYVYEIDIIQ